MGWVRVRQVPKAVRIVAFEVLFGLCVAVGVGLVVGALVGATAGIGVSLVALGAIGFVFVIAYERGANAG